MSDWNFSGNFTNHGAWNLNTIFITLLVTFFSLPSILSTYSITSENKVMNNESYITNHKLPRKLLASALILCMYCLWITPLHFPIYSNAKIIVGEKIQSSRFYLGKDSDHVNALNALDVFGFEAILRREYCVQNIQDIERKAKRQISFDFESILGSISLISRFVVRGCYLEMHLSMKMK